MSPKISVILPTYKRPDFLEKSLGSVLSQTYRDWECIVINDDPLSSAEVDTVITAFDDQRIRVVHNAQNLGIAGARNAGIRIARGELLALLDDDDYWKPDHLQLVIKAFEEDPSTVFAYSGYIRQVEGAIEKIDEYMPAVAPPEDVFSSMMEADFTINVASILSFRAKTLRKIGYFDSELNGFEDWDMCLRMSIEGKSVAIPQASVVQRVHFGKRLSTAFDARMDVLKKLRHKWGTYPGFRRVYARYQIEAYHAEVINEVMAQNVKSRFRLLKNCLLRCEFSNFLSVKVYIKSLLIALGGVRMVKRFG